MNIVKAVIGLVVSAAFLFIFAQGVDWSEVKHALGGARYEFLVLATVLLVFVTGFQAYRWKVLLDRFGHVDTRETYQALLIGHAANIVLPVRAGDLMRAFLANKRFGVRRSAALGTIVLERLLDGVAVVLLLALGLVLANSLGGLGSLLFSGAAIVALLIAGLALSVVLGRRHLPRVLSKLMPVDGIRLGFRGRRTVIHHDRINSSLGQIFEGVAAARDPRTGGLALASTLLFWAGMVLVYYVASLAFDLPRNPLVFVVVVGAANLALAVPSSPSGLGPFDYFAREALLLHAADSSEATAYVLALHLALALPLLALGLVFAWSSGLSLTGTARIAKEAPPADPVVRAQEGSVPLVPTHSARPPAPGDLAADYDVPARSPRRTQGQGD